MRVGLWRQAGIGGSDEIDLAALRRLLVSRWRWIVVPTVIAFVASTVIVNLIHARYTAEARIVLENQRNYLPGPDRPETANTQQLDAEAVGSQVQILTSRDLARRVIKAVGLQGNPEFDPLANGVGALDRILILVGLKRDPTRLSPEDRILESYFDRLTVLSPLKTRVLTVEFTSRDPDLSARVANTIAEFYLEFQSDAKRSEARAAAESLGAMVVDLKRRVAAADEKVETFRSQTGLLMGTNNNSINAQQLADVNTELARARTAQADAAAKAVLLREMLKKRQIEFLPEVVNNELVRRISEQRVAARAQLALESRTLLPQHPRIKELMGQVTELDEQVRAAAEKTARSLETESRVAGGRVDNLARALDTQKKIIGESGSDEVQLRALERSAAALKDELTTTTTRYQEALARESSKATPSDARIFSRALAPPLPSYPKRIPIIAFVTIATLLMSAAIVAMRDFLAEARDETADVVVAPVPVVAAEAAPADPIAPAAEADTPDVTTEAAQARARDFGAQIDTIAADIETLGLSNGGLILVANLAGDDDDGLALALARRLGQQGRAILIAGDAHTITPLRSEAGLGDLMNGVSSFAEVIFRDRNARLHIIPPGRQFPAMQAEIGPVLDALKGTYDSVVLGAPRAMDPQEADSVMRRTEIAVVGAGPDSAALLGALESAGVRHVLHVHDEHSETLTAA
jgi:succinoglycan biosynthesis transport protein ExoP